MRYWVLGISNSVPRSGADSKNQNHILTSQGKQFSYLLILTCFPSSSMTKSMGMVVIRDKYFGIGMCYQMVTKRPGRARWLNPRISPCPSDVSSSRPADGWTTAIYSSIVGWTSGCVWQIIILPRHRLPPRRVGTRSGSGHRPNTNYNKKKEKQIKSETSRRATSVLKGIL